MMRSAENRGSTKILITGFGPFPGMRVNPTAALIHDLAKRRRLMRPGLHIRTHIFATRYDAVDRDLPRLLAEFRPHAVLLFGVAGRTAHLRIEMCARNVQSALLVDAGGMAPPSRAVAGRASVTNGRAPFPVLLVAALRTGVPVKLSRDAGRYLCNYAYGQALAATHHAQPTVFVHVPKLSTAQRRRTRSRGRSVTMNALVRTAEALVLLMPLVVRNRR